MYCSVYTIKQQRWIVRKLRVATLIKGFYVAFPATRALASPEFFPLTMYVHFAWFQMGAWCLAQKLSEGEAGSLRGRTLEYHGNVC